MYVETDKWLYFRTRPHEWEDDGYHADGDTYKVTSACFPARNLASIVPASDTKFRMYFSSVRNSESIHSDLSLMDYVNVNCVQGSLFEAMRSVLEAINSGPNNDGFIIIADDVTTNAAEESVIAKTISQYVTSCEYIIVHPDNSGGGRMPSLGVGNAAPTTISAATEGAGGDVNGTIAFDELPGSGDSNFPLNTHYYITDDGARAFTLPSARKYNVGDWLTITYTAELGNVLHSYTTADTNYALGSRIFVEGQDGTRINKIDTSIANDDIIKITGTANGDGGIGTTLKFVNVTGEVNGWAADVVVKGKGAMSAASSAATAFDQG